MFKQVPPQSNRALLAWAANTARQIAAGYATFGISEQMSTEYQTTFTRFSDLMAKMDDPDQQTPNVRLERDAARRHLLNASRAVIRLAKAHPGISDEQLNLLNIPIPDREPTPIGVPTQEPNLSVVEVQGRHVTLELRDDEGRRRKPNGCRGANLFTYVGEQPPEDIDQWKFEGGTTRTKVTHSFPQTVPPATKVWFVAMWFNPRMQTGYACQPVSTYTTGGAMAKAA